MTTRRIGIINPYWSFWESAVEGDFAADRRELADVALSTLSGVIDVTWSVTVQPGDDIEALSAELDREIEAIVVVSTMAASPGSVLELLAAFPKAPVVIWAAHLGLEVDQDLSHSGITLRGGTVGSPMLGAALTKQGRPHDLVAGEITDPARIGPAVVQAAVAGVVRRSRLGIVGNTIPGYEWERISNGRLAELGVEVVERDASELANRVRAVSPSSVDEARLCMDGFAIDPDVSEGALGTAARYTAALASLVADENLAAGTLNCHVASLRLDPEIGSAPCFALGRSTSLGVPWTCTGDVATSLAMLMVTALGAPTLYHEIEALDEVTSEAILANSGEHDSRFRSEAPQRIINNPWFPLDKATASAMFSIAEGPASLVAVSSGADGALTVIVAEGRFTSRSSPDSGTMNAAFVFESGPITEAWERWGKAGAGHHSCATDRHVARDLESVCRHLGIGFVEV